MSAKASASLGLHGAKELVAIGTLREGWIELAGGSGGVSAPNSDATHASVDETFQERSSATDEVSHKINNQILPDAVSLDSRWRLLGRVGASSRNQPFPERNILIDNIVPRLQSTCPETGQNSSI